MEILRVENLCRTYGKGEAKVNALKDVSFSLEKGEFAAAVGESGLGKSTLLNCIGALDNPDSGTILIDRQSLFSMKEEERTIFRRCDIGFVFQSFQLVTITRNAKEYLGLKIGDTVVINKPDGTELHYIISGFCNDTSKTMSEDSYGFLAVVALITIFNIINSIALSVAARTKQYGVSWD